MGTFPRYSSSLPAMGRAGRDYLPSSKGDKSMPHAITTFTKTKKRNHLILFSTGLIILALLVAACGGARTGTNASSNKQEQHHPVSRTVPDQVACRQYGGEGYTARGCRSAGMDQHD